MKPNPFSRGLLAVWLACAAALFVVSFITMNSSQFGFRETDRTGPGTHSISAIGHAAAYRTLERLGMPVLRDSGESARRDDLVILAEPPSQPSAIARVRRQMRKSATLLVLPKRTGAPDPEKPNYIGRDSILNASSVEAVLKTLDPLASIGRFGALGDFTSAESFSFKPELRQAQLFQSSRIKPLLETPDGAIVGLFQNQDGVLYILSDPDIIANHGLGHGDNAALFVAVVNAARNGKGRVIFDETLHGWGGDGPTAWILFKWPYVLVTGQICVALAILAWASAGRFGSPAAAPPRLSAGSSALLDNAERLLDVRAATPYLAGRYAEALVRDTARLVHAPHASTLPQLHSWFERTGRPVPPAAANESAPSATAWSDFVRSLHTWRDRVLNGTERDSPRR